MKYALFLFFVFSLFYPKTVLANDKQNFITVVNPVRIAPYTNNPRAVLESQYAVISKYQIPATWLLTYDSILDNQTQNATSRFDNDQELGIFLEVNEKLAKDADVDYDESVAWHYSKNVFLSGYTQSDREKLIDAVFEKFKTVYGYYPVSVGSWWTDSYSLAYMREKYAIEANLTVADQFNTDNYQLWGQYWTLPYYPSSKHSGIPAQDSENQIDVVMIQWAPRDPLNGYYSSLFSTQDYKVRGVSQDTKYFSNLLRTYLNQQNDFNQLVVGLEGDLSPEAYVGAEYEKQISIVNSLRLSGDLELSTMSEFANWIKQKHPTNPVYFIDSKDILNTQRRVFWYNSPKYRLSVQYDADTGKVRINDFRVYGDNVFEPYYKAPNKSLKLSIYVPSVIDEIRGDRVEEMDGGELIIVEKVEDRVKLEFENGEIVLHPESFDVGIENNIKKNLYNSSLVSVQGGATTIVSPQTNLVSTSDSISFEDLTREATYELRRKRTKAIVGAMVFVFVGFGMVLYIYKDPIKTLLVYYPVGILLGVLIWGLWFMSNSQDYSIHQEETYALEFLSTQPQGRVLVVDNECLGCDWYTLYVPAAFHNKREYVEIYSGKPIVYNSSVFEAKDQGSAKIAFDKTNADYIYLVRYGDYREKTPFSPGDLGVEKIFQNAYSEIWKTTE
ncbi:hypothetical protein ACFL2C_00915 [Patescibacteria group bacterium]